MNQEPTPAKVRLTDGLGPLPEAAFPVVREGDLQTACWEVDTYTAEQMRAYAAQAVAAEREPANVVLRALLLAAWGAPGTRTAGEMRAAAVTLFGAAAVDAAMARIRA